MTEPTKDESTAAKIERCAIFGLIGGLGPRATVRYYQELVKTQPGELLLVHADEDRVLRDVAGGDRTGLAAYLARLLAGGAEGRIILSQIARDLAVDATVLAGTDLSLIFDESNTDFQHVDCARVHIQAIMREQHNVGFRQSE